MRDGGRNPVACGSTRGLGNAAADRLLFPTACHPRPWRALAPQDVLALAAANPAARQICLRQGTFAPKRRWQPAGRRWRPTLAAAAALMLLWSTNAVLDHLALSRRADAAQEASRAFYRQWFKTIKRYQPAPADAAAPAPAGSDNRRLTAGRPYSQLAKYGLRHPGFSCGR